MERNNQRGGVTKYQLYGLGGLLLLAGFGGLLNGGSSAIGGIIWIVCGLITIPETRSGVFRAIEGAGGPDVSSLGTGSLAIIVIGAFLLGGVLVGAGGGGAPTETVGQDSDPADQGTPINTDTSDGSMDQTTATPEATPTPTPRSTPTPTPTQTSTPEPTPAPDGDSYEYSGSGQTATDRFRTEGGLLTLDLSHQGERNFIVYLVNADTGEEELLVNTIGDFEGTVATNVPDGEFLLDIEADGNWKAGIEQPRYSLAEVSALPADESKNDYAVLGPYQFEGVTRFTIDAETESNVIAYLMDHEGNEVELLVNELGPHEGSTTIRQEGVGLIFVETEGSWTVTLEQA